MNNPTHHNRDSHANHELNRHQPFYKSFTTNAWVALGTVVGIIIFYLLTHHKTHVLDVLPYVLILAMVLMHIDGHGGHNHGGKHHE